MPNWCNNFMTVSADAERFYNDLSEAYAKAQGNGIQLAAAGENSDFMFLDDVPILGEIICYQTKWSPNIDDLRKFAEYYKIDIVVEFEETGNLIFGKWSHVGGVESMVELEDADWDLFTYNEETNDYLYKGERWECDIDILEDILKQKCL